MRIKNPDKFYIFDCGCRVPVEKVRRYRNFKRCPDHLESRIEFIEFICACGKLVTVDKTKTMQSVCDECKVAKRKRTNRSVQKSVKSWRIEQKDDASHTVSTDGRCRICGARLNYMNQTGQCLCHSEDAGKDWGRDEWAKSGKPRNIADFGIAL